MWTVPKVLRPLAMCVVLVLSDILGDIPAPALFGLNVDFLTNRFHKTEEMAFRIAFVVAEFFVILQGLVCLFGIFQSKTAKDYREESTESLIDNNIQDEGTL